MKPMPKEYDEMALALYAEGLTRAQIAERMGTTKGAICGKLWRLGKKSPLPSVNKPVPEPEMVVAPDDPPMPVVPLKAGLTPETRAYFEADAETMRRHGLITEASLVVMDLDSFDRLARKYRLAGHTRHLPTVPGFQ